MRSRLRSICLGIGLPPAPYDLGAGWKCVLDQYWPEPVMWNNRAVSPSITTGPDYPFAVFTGKDDLPI